MDQPSAERAVNASRRPSQVVDRKAMQLKEYDQRESFAPVICKDYSHLLGAP